MCWLAVQEVLCKPKVVATINILADITQQIAGNALEVESLLPTGTDPHAYEPSPGDARRIAQADVIVRNGLHLEGWLDKLIQSAGGNAHLITAASRVKAIQANDYANSFDPHAWMSLDNALLYVDEIEAGLSKEFPAFQAVFAQNALRYKQKIQEAEVQVWRWVNAIPENRRHIITSHDAFRYFARRYNFGVASILGTSTDADVSLADINHLIQVVRDYQVPAIFIEAALNPKILQQLAQDLGIRIGGHLYTDSFGPKGSDADSYLAMILHNTRTLNLALSATEASQGIATSGNLGLVLVVTVAFLLAFAWVWIRVYPRFYDQANWNDYSLKVENLTVMLGRKVILSNLFLELKPGRLYGILGSNGSGKSTLVKTIVGLYTPISGSIRLHKKPVSHFLRHIAYLPQKEEFDMQFPVTVADVVKLGFFPEQSGLGGLSAQQIQQFERVLKEVEISHLRDRPISQLSGGQFQRTLLARALCQNAEIIILDEPFVGIDHATEEILMNLLRDLVKQGKMIIMVHHDLTRVRMYFDELVMINQRIVAQGPVEQVFTEENIRATYSGKVTLLQKALQLVNPDQP
jgi:ABC-type Mn2+/Zn2+ transport system ATPase subunit/ABC-type Zn uptake system ZnuABC Zn-binding protein ZnuA